MWNLELWTPLLYLLIPVVLGIVVVRLIGEVSVPKSKLGSNAQTLLGKAASPDASDGNDAQEAPRSPSDA